MPHQLASFLRSLPVIEAFDRCYWHSIEGFLVVVGVLLCSWRLGSLLTVERDSLGSDAKNSGPTAISTPSAFSQLGTW